MIDASAESSGFDGDKRALEAFVVDNPELVTLEGALREFNMFEAIGIVRQELRHSDFLAFLLDPRQSHRLGDAFVQRFLQRVLVSQSNHVAKLSAVHVDSWNMDNLVVSREWENIDLLLVDQFNRVVVIIENKVDSSEHSDQLGRYLRRIKQDFPDPEWQHVPIYLTPDGTLPSENSFLVADYGLVADTVDFVSESRRSSMDPAVFQVMEHYSRMLRRHIVTDSEIADLCRRIYQRHQRALDLIFEHRPDRLSEIQAVVLELIGSCADLIVDTSSKQLVRFGHASWESLPRGSDWTKSGRMVLFEIDSYRDRLSLNLYVGPGPSEIRSQLVQLAASLQPPFRLARGRTTENQKWKSIFSYVFLKKQDYEGASIAELEARIRHRWERFVDELLPRLAEPIADFAKVAETSELGLVTQGHIAK